MNGYVDCHCHLGDSEFDQDLEDVIKKAKQNDVFGILVVSINTSEFEKIIQMAKSYPDILLPCLGVHPVQEEEGEQRCAKLQDVEEALPLIEKYKDEIAAIGEIGLDFQPRICKLPEDKDVQKEVLRKQVEIANKYDLPVNVHSRSAGRPTIAALKEFGAEKVLLHAFDGRPSVAMEGVKAGYYFSIPPSIVRSEQKQKLVKQLPLENMLLETDSPALGPEKGVRNVPSNIRLSCDYIASIKKIDSTEVRRVTMQNALKLFPKLTRIIK